MTLPDPWLTLGLLAQACFSSRFLLQWIASERRKKPVVPRAFWILSILGAAGLLAYAIRIKDPVFILGNTFGVFIYARNLMLSRRNAPDDGYD